MLDFNKKAYKEVMSIALRAFPVIVFILHTKGFYHTILLKHNKNMECFRAIFVAKTNGKFLATFTWSFLIGAIY